jgi:hypothetical protein
VPTAGPAFVCQAFAEFGEELLESGLVQARHRDHLSGTAARSKHCVQSCADPLRMF